MAEPTAAWDPQDLAALLVLDEVAPLRYRNRFHDPNQNGRAYGGQVLGQALASAARSVPPGRRANAMQALFLQGTKVGEPIDYLVTPLQDGKRFSARHVRGLQGSTMSLDTHISFCTELDGPAHTTPAPQGVPGPEGLPRLPELSARLRARMQWLGTYSLDEKPSIDFRVVEPPADVVDSNAWTTLHCWMRAARPLPQQPHMEAAALAYMSDWWTNFTSMGPQLGAATQEPGLYMVSLNHSVWLHRPHDPNEWLLVASDSPICYQGRGLSNARLYDRAGNLVASVAQECLMARG